jgi:hypothetical protein
MAEDAVLNAGGGRYERRSSHKHRHEKRHEQSHEQSQGPSLKSRRGADRYGNERGIFGKLQHFIGYKSQHAAFKPLQEAVKQALKIDSRITEASLRKLERPARKTFKELPYLADLSPHDLARILLSLKDRDMVKRLDLNKDARKALKQVHRDMKHARKDADHNQKPRSSGLAAWYSASPKRSSSQYEKEARKKDQAKRAVLMQIAAGVLNMDVDDRIQQDPHLLLAPASSRKLGGLVNAKLSSLDRRQLVDLIVISNDLKRHSSIVGALGRLENMHNVSKKLANWATKKILGAFDKWYAAYQEKKHLRKHD